MAPLSFTRSLSLTGLLHYAHVKARARAAPRREKDGSGKDTHGAMSSAETPRRILQSRPVWATHTPRARRERDGGGKDSRGAISMARLQQLFIACRAAGPAAATANAAEGA